ncbi:MAG: bifunctional UDP-N-acetylmuramoyl-tripeptide:D-alanyl-D-alanine ligase/alanine racemase [Bacteroidota bacterium]
MLFSEIAKITGGQSLRLTKDNTISELYIDSRSVTNPKGSVFFCLKGHQHDGHQFISQVHQKGIRNFVISDDTDVPVDANVIGVNDTLDALQQVAIHHRSLFAVPVIGITGSNGKTMIKEWLSTVLQEKYRVVKSPKSYNSQIGVPLSVWQLNADHEIGVFEAGISKSGEMEKLEKIIQPTIGIFTNIGEAHDEGFSSIRKKIEEKSKLFQNAEKIICCRDHTEIFNHLTNTYPEKVIDWSTSAESSITITTFDEQYTFRFNNQSYSFRFSHRKPYDIENLFHVISASIVCGLDKDEIERGLKQIIPVPMRLELKQGVNDTYILDDTYNNDLAGLKIALNYQNQQVQYAHKTVILSDILQSGMYDYQLYQEVNELLVNHNVGRFIGIGTQISAEKDVFAMKKDFFPDVESFLSSDLSFANEMILIKGARVFGLERIVSFLEEKNHGTILEVNFEALTHNLNVYRNHLNPGVKLMVMVKAFAYGGGIAEIANLLQYQKVDRLGVAYVDEGIILRKHGIKIPIVVMNPNWEALSLLTSFNLEAEVYSISMLNHMLVNLKSFPAIHLKIETGMNRLGIQEKDVEELISILSEHPEIKLAGIFTHLSSQEDEANDSYTSSQLEIFDRMYDRISEKLDPKPIKHVLNSAGIIRWPDHQYDMVRLGIGLYGYDASSKVNDLQPISTLKTIVSQVKQVKKGESIGYSRMGKASKNGQIAILPIGYADGYLRMFGNGKAYTLINGQKAPTIGNICMDTTMIDVTGLDAKEGDEVILFGQNPTIVQLAEWAQTIPYEILTNVSQRVKRVFRSE